MVPGTRHRFPTWQQALFLLVLGVIAGYPTGVEVGRGMWGSASRYHAWFVFGFFAAAVAFISGFISFFAIAVKALTSPPAIGPALAASSRIAGAGYDDLSPGAGVERIASVTGNSITLLTGLHIALVAEVSVACIDMGNRGGPALTSGYGKYYWLLSVLTLVLSQLPYAIVLIRTWKVPDRVALALAIATGATQVLATVLLRDVHYTLAHNAWLWLSALLGLTVAVFAYLTWWPSVSRKGDFGILVSMIFGFLAYTALTQLALTILSTRLRV